MIENPRKEIETIKKRIEWKFQNLKVEYLKKKLDLFGRIASVNLALKKVITQSSPRKSHFEDGFCKATLMKIKADEYTWKKYKTKHCRYL